MQNTHDSLDIPIPYRNPGCCVILAGDAAAGRKVRPSDL